MANAWDWGIFVEELGLYLLIRKENKSSLFILTH